MGCSNLISIVNTLRLIFEKKSKLAFHYEVKTKYIAVPSQDSNRGWNVLPPSFLLLGGGNPPDDTADTASVVVAIAPPPVAVPLVVLLLLLLSGMKMLRLVVEKVRTAGVCNTGQSGN